MWLLMSLALAAPPDRVAASIDPTASSLDGLAMSEDGRLVTAVDSAGKLLVLDTHTWTTSHSSACIAYGAVPYRGDATDDEYSIYVACLDGTVTALSWENGSISTDTSVGDSGIWDLSDGSDTISAYGVWLFAGVEDDSADDALYVLTFDDQGSDVSDALAMRKIGLASRSVDTTYAATFIRNSYIDASVVSNAGLGTFYIGHESTHLHFLSLNGTTISTANGTTGTFNVGTITDVSPFNNSVLVVGTSSVGRYYTGTPGTYTSFLPIGTNLSSPTAVAADPDGSWVAISHADGVAIWPNTGLIADDTSSGVLPFYDPATTATIKDMIAADGYAYGGSSDGTFEIITSNPWLSAVSLDPEAAITGDSVTIHFTTDRDGSYTVQHRPHTGTTAELGQGTASAGDAISVAFDVQDSWDEGDVPIWITYTTAGVDDGEMRIDLLKDDPPPTVVLSADNVGFGDRRVTIEFDGSDIEDLDHYELYFSPTAFESGTDAVYVSTGTDYLSGDVEGPISITEVEPGQEVTYTVSPLTNDVPYYFAVRTIDASDQESPMSDVISKTPESTTAPHESYGEPGGPICSTGPSSAGWLAMLPVGLLVLRRRGAALATASALTLVAAPASAIELPKDQTESVGNFEMKYGSLTFPRTTTTDADGNTVTSLAALDEAYGGDNGKLTGLYIEAGPAFWQLVELDIGLGYHSKKGFQVGVVSGDTSIDEANMTWWDLQLAATGRLQIFDEQPLVPFARYGFNHLIWREAWDKSDDVVADPDRPFRPGTKDKISGAFRGNHTALGVNILLDVFQPGRAGMLEADTGINDTWIVLEWRNQTIANRVGDNETGTDADGEPLRGYDFSGSLFTAGLKLDF